MKVKLCQEMLTDQSNTEVVMQYYQGHVLYESLSKAYSGGKERELFDTYLERYFGLVVSNGEKGITRHQVNHVRNHYLQFTVHMGK